MAQTRAPYPANQPDPGEPDPQWETITESFGRNGSAYVDFKHNPDSIDTYSCLHEPDGTLISGGTFGVFRARLISFDAERYPDPLEDFSDLLGPHDDRQKLLQVVPPPLAQQISEYWGEWKATVLAYQDIGYDFVLDENDPEPWQATHESTSEVIKAATYLEFHELFDKFYREHGGA